MKIRLQGIALLLSTLFMMLPVVQAGAPPAAGLSAAAAMEDIAGVYKRPVKHPLLPGQKPEDDTPYADEDVVEILPFDATHVYVRARLEFSDGQSCAIYGMAGFEKNGFVFHDPSMGDPADNEGAPACTLTVGRSGAALTLSDRPGGKGPGTCRAYCSAGGSLSAIALPMSARRPIRYVKRIEASSEYRKAAGMLKQLGARQADASR